jgi:hypothetical protein
MYPSCAHVLGAQAVTPPSSLKKPMPTTDASLGPRLLVGDELPQDATVIATIVATRREVSHPPKRVCIDVLATSYGQESK